MSWLRMAISRVMRGRGKVDVSSRRRGSGCVVAMYCMWGAVEVDASLRDLMQAVKKYPVRELADAFKVCHVPSANVVH